MGKTKPHARRINGFWWVFHSRKDAYRKSAKGWHGRTVQEAYESYARFNRMKP